MAINTGTFSASYVNTLIDTAVSKGASRDKLLLTSKLCETDLAIPSKRINSIEVAQLIYAAITLTNDPAFGLCVGEHVTASSFNVHGYMLMSCRTATEAINLLPTYEKIVTDVATCHVEHLDCGVKISWHPQLSDSAFEQSMSEAILSGWYYFGRWISGKDIRFTEICFAHEEPAYLDNYEKIFQCPIKFQQSEYSVLIPRSYLDYPILQSDPELQQLMKEKATQLLKQIELKECNSLKVSHLLHENLAYIQPSISQISQSMNMSERTLRRRLKDEGTTYKEILNNCRKEAARLYLADQSLSIIEVANLLGYESQSSFTQVCKEWFNATPTQCRKTLRL